MKYDFSMLGHTKNCQESSSHEIFFSFGLEFNGLVNTIKVMWSRAVYLTTLFLGMLSLVSG